MIVWIELFLQITLLLGIAMCAATALRKHPAIVHFVWAVVLLGTIIVLPLRDWVGPIAFLGIGDEVEQAREAQIYAANGSQISGPIKQATLLSESSKQNPKQSERISTDTILWLVWLSGALFFLGRTLTGIAYLSHIRRRSSHQVHPSDLQVDFHTIVGKIGLKKAWEIRISDSPKTATAMTWGLFQSVVLLPKGADQWTPERLEAVLLHELAHVRRKDFASQLLAELACALYWYHPLAWIGARSMKENAELAADDVVLRSGVKATSYAAELLCLAAELGGRQKQFIQSGVHLMSKPKIESRIRSILSPTARRRGLTSIQLLAALLIVGVSVTAIAGVRLGNAPADKHKGSRASQDEQVALKRIKALVTATNIFWADHDDLLPNAASTAVAKTALAAYMLERENFDSPSKGGSFEFNVNLSGINMSSVPDPSQVPVWYEKLPSVGSVAVAYLDCHVELVAPNDQPALQEALKKKYTSAAKANSVASIGK